MCAQFDTRSTRARTEFLGGLEDVLASIQPSTFVDEQLSRYKGMTWNEFLEELDSRRSSSSYALPKNVHDHGTNSGINPNSINNNNNNEEPLNDSGLIDSVRSAISREGSRYAKSSAGGGGGSKRNHHVKPTLKRGQTVDSVFRLPLIPTSTVASPRHQPNNSNNTKTSMLMREDSFNRGEERDRERQRATKTSSNDLMLLVSADTSPSGGGHQNTPNRSRIGSPQGRTTSGSDSTALSARLINQDSFEQQSASGGPQTEAPIGNNGNQSSDKGSNAGNNGGSSHIKRLDTIDGEGSFDTDDALDLLTNSPTHMIKRHVQQMARQSSLTTLTSTISRAEQKRQRALWDLFQSECTFFYDHLMTLKNVYMEPLKKIQVEGFAMFADPDVLFGNLDELCCGVYDFCKEFLSIIMRTLKNHPNELNATEILIKLYKRNPKIDQLRGVYHRYTLNYINALTYLETLRRQVEFVEFEKWSSRDLRCNKLQLTDLLVAPVQHIMRVPIILKDIESRTENPRDREEIRTILSVEEASLRELDDKMRWLKNFERLLEIQKNIHWPNLFELDPKIYVPEFLKEALSKQPCEKLIVSPRRQIVFEGTISNLDLGKPCDVHMILFDDMLLITRRKKGLTKKASTVCKPNPLGGSAKEEGSFKYVVYKQPLSLDRFYVHDVQAIDAASAGLKNLFLLIVLNRFQQITFVHTFSAQTDELKQTWIYKIKKTAERWKRNFQNSIFRSGAQQQQQHQQQQHQHQTGERHMSTGSDAQVQVDQPVRNRQSHYPTSSTQTNNQMLIQQQQQQQQQQRHHQTVITNQPISSSSLLDQTPSTLNDKYNTTSASVAPPSVPPPTFSINHADPITTLPQRVPPPPLSPLKDQQQQQQQQQVDHHEQKLEGATHNYATQNQNNEKLDPTGRGAEVAAAANQSHHHFSLVMPIGQEDNNQASLSELSEVEKGGSSNLLSSNIQISPLTPNKKPPIPKRTGFVGIMISGSSIDEPTESNNSSSSQQQQVVANIDKDRNTSGNNKINCVGSNEGQDKIVHYSSLL